MIDEKIRVTKLLAVLSRPGALSIFEQAGIGIKICKDAHLKLGLTQKQHYSRLSQLVKAGLVEKVSGSYMQTKFGC